MTRREFDPFTSKSRVRVLSDKDIQEIEQLIVEMKEEYELEDAFEYDVAPSASPIRKETVRVRIRNIKEAPPLERSF